MTALSLFGRLSRTLQEVTDDNMDRCSEFISMAQFKLYSANSNMTHDSHHAGNKETGDKC